MILTQTTADGVCHAKTKISSMIRKRATLAAIFLVLALASVGRAQTNAHSVARVWDERALAAIRVDTPNPPVQARNLFSFSVCMYDAWAAYDTNGAIGFVYHGKHTAADIEAARAEAISYAVYRLMKERHYYSKTSTNTLAADDALMATLGYDTNNVSRDLSTPAGVGNSIYDAVSAWFINDGSRQTNGTQSAPYPDYPASQGGYVYVNPPLAVALEGIDDGSGNTVKDINKWQRLQIVNAFDQNGFPQGPIQNYLGVQWLTVRPFSLERIDPTLPWIDPGPPPYFGTATHQGFVDSAVAMIQASSQLTPDDGVDIDISPAAPNGFGNNSIDAIDGHGYTNNPVTGQPYVPNIAKRGDWVRVLAEFWADGPSSETPPGHWNVIANNVSDSPLTVKRIGGVGPIVNSLEWDVKVYFSVNAAVHDAACAAWGLKRYYNGWRPLSAVRYLAGLGQSSDPSLPSFNTNGLPLITNLIEVVTTASAAPGGRHAGMIPGKIVIDAWPGPPNNPVTTYQGIKWYYADSWLPYQRTNFVTPAFPGYISGHSTFSRAAAEVMTRITGSPFFPGGMGTYTVTNLNFEKGPTQPVVLQYATYYDASDLAGLSRIWGGIHPPVDNLAGRHVGATVGQGVWARAQLYFNGTWTNEPITLTQHSLGGGTNEIRFSTLRGLYYKTQSTTNLTSPFVDDPAGYVQAMNSSIAVTNGTGDPQRFFRAAGTPTP